MRARGLVNTGNIGSANAVLQLLVNFPPFCNLFREVGVLKGHYRAGVPEIGSGATPLVDATVRFFKEFIVKEESPSMQQQPQPATGGTSKADGEEKDENVDGPFDPTYLYDAMKNKSQLKLLLVRSCAYAAASCH
jgi:ubiquitin carboxyl-terminal hydrolase 10